MPATHEAGPPRDPGGPEIVLAFDFGHKRIGVAVGQELTATATPLGAVVHRRDGPDWRRLDALLDEWRPARLLVGLPLLPDGSEGSMAASTRRFCAALERYALPVETVDERYSSLEAGARLKRRRRQGLWRRIRKENVDAQSAALIAERWLRQRA